MARRTRRKARDGYAVLFGFDVRDKERTGYVGEGERGLAVVDDVRKAKTFALSAEPGHGTPEDWRDFFRSEPGLSSWRFHPVVLDRELP